MRRLMLLILIAGLLALPALGADETKPPAKQFVVEVYDLQLSRLLDLLAKETGISYAVVPPELAQKAITINAGGAPIDLQGALEMLRAAGIDNMRVGDTYVFYARTGTAAATIGPVVTPPAAGEEPTVTVDFRDAPLSDALRLIFRDTRYSFAIGPRTKEAPRVTLTLQDVPFSTALQVIAQAANVDILREPGNSNIYRVVPRPTVTMGGTQIPVVGAVTLGPGADGGAAGGAAGLPAPGSGLGTNPLVWPSGTPAFTWPTGTAPFPSAGGPAFVFPEPGPQVPATTLPTAAAGEKLVDLDVKDMSIREAMARLAKASGFQITVHPAVPKGIKVTARAFGVPAEWLLNQIVEQAHLTVVKEAVKGKPSAAKAYRYHIVPVPTIRISAAPDLPRRPKEPVLYPVDPRYLPQPGPQRLPIAGGVYLLQSGSATPPIPAR